LEASSAADAQAAVDAERRIRLVQGVEVDSIDVMIEKIPALLGRPMKSDLRDRVFIVLPRPGE
jgi:hypothetical protein